MKANYPRYVLAVLLASYTMNSLDRAIIAVLLDPIGREFNVTDRSQASTGQALDAQSSGIHEETLVRPAEVTRASRELSAVDRSLVLPLITETERGGEHRAPRRFRPGMSHGLHRSYPTSARAARSQRAL